jgi:hypothetical protein
MGFVLWRHIPASVHEGQCDVHVLAVNVLAGTPKNRSPYDFDYRPSFGHALVESRTGVTVY